MTDAARFVRAGAFTAVSDFCFACVLSIYFFGGTFTRLWSGVASVPLGQPGPNDITTWTIAGIGFHILVAFTWSAIFVFVVSRIPIVGRMTEAPLGILAVAAVYGPIIWVVMSFGLIPLFTHRMPTVTYRWFVQMGGHVFFVALPMILGQRTVRN